MTTKVFTFENWDTDRLLSEWSADGETTRRFATEDKFLVIT